MGFWDNVKNAVDQGANNTADVIRQGGDKAAEVIVANAYLERFLTNDEIALGARVYQGTVPWRSILLSNGLGFGYREYTISHPTILGCYLIHWGPDYWGDARDNAGTFIHELCHVWQGHNNFFPLHYVFQSCWHQAASGAGAYTVDPADLGVQPWHWFNVEQQAKIVEKWFEDGLSEGENDRRFPYVRDNVRGLQRDSGSRTSTTLFRGIEKRFLRKG